MKTLKKLSLILLYLSPFSLFAQDKGSEKIQKSTVVVNEFAGMKEDIPAQLMKRAEGIVIIPNLINAGLGVGGQRGKGVAMVKKSDGRWSDPVFVTLTGGSIGFQAGVQSIDLVMVFMKGSTLRKIGDGEFTLGGNISVAAGPVGRSTSAATDPKLDAEVYSYSRSKGLFAGISLSGSRLSVDQDANAAFYKTKSSATAIFNKPGSTHKGIVSLKNSVKALY